jgi:hypothetical protein
VYPFQGENDEEIFYPFWSQKVYIQETNGYWMIWKDIRIRNG